MNNARLKVEIGDVLIFIHKLGYFSHLFTHNKEYIVLALDYAGNPQLLLDNNTKEHVIADSTFFKLKPKITIRYIVDYQLFNNKLTEYYNTKINGI